VASGEPGTLVAERRVVRAISKICVLMTCDFMGTSVFLWSDLSLFKLNPVSRYHLIKTHPDDFVKVFGQA
jgi:hypothetical protein